MSFIRIITKKPVAYDSPDYIQPWGTIRDSSVNLSFNRKLSWWIPEKLRVLDLGCSGGGFVKSILDNGGFAIGIEGSDYSKKNKRAEWAIIPDNLFTADITEPFKLIETGDNNKEQILEFNIITAWEVIEHIKADKLLVVFKNIDAHLASNGIVIMSISTKEEITDGMRLHQTVKSRGWWLKKISELGFKHHENVSSYFYYDWVRGRGVDDEFSFNVVLTRRDEDLPYKTRLKFLKIIIWPLNIAKRFLRWMYKKFLWILPRPIKQVIKNLFEII